ncbi:MAG TPA: YdcF family protein [Gallionellaceae bacterium]|nr:YdcF family protein [Gallionellaceae bacterium]
MSWFFTNLIAAVLSLPLNLLLISVLGILLWHKHPRVALTLFSSAVVLLWLLSTPFLAEALLHALEGSSATLNGTLKPHNNGQTAEAIIVLGGGSYFHPPEYAEDTVNAASLQRLRYAAKLYRDVKKPVLLSGGSPQGNSVSEAQQMKGVLEQEFNTPVQWIEDKSANTLESARFSYHLLHESGIKRIYLVTHASHMPRALRVFHAAGFEVVPAPTAYTTRHQTDLLSFIPNAKALQDSQIFLHEVIGMMWYRLKS